MERNGKLPTRWFSGIVLLVLLAACAPVQEAPQGITGVWKATATSTTGQEMSKSFWIEQGIGSSISVKNEPGASGTFTSPTLTLAFNNPDDGSSTTLNGTKSGNQITGTYTVTAGGSTIDSGTFWMDFQMHPADLDTGQSYVWVSSWSGTVYLDFSKPYPWVNATDNYDASVQWGGSNFIMAPGPGASIFPGTSSANQEDFWVRANVGGPLDAALGTFTVGVPIENVGQLFFVKTRENRFAMVWVESLVPGSSVNLRSIYGYGGYAFNGTPPNNQTYVQRRRTGASGPVTLRFFMELRDPDTNLPVDPNRLDTTSFRVAASNFAGTQMPVKSGTEEAYEATYYAGLADNVSYIRRQVAMAGDLNVTGLATGYYGLRARDILGYTYVGLAYHDNTLNPSALSPAGMSKSADNTVLSVQNPGLTTSSYPGFTVQFSVFITTVPDNKTAFGATLLLQDGVDTYTFVVPPSAVTFLKTKGALQWQALVRYYINGYEVFRHYSDPQSISF
jgi:hypothetical protein